MMRNKNGNALTTIILIIVIILIILTLGFIYVIMIYDNKDLEEKVTEISQNSNINEYINIIPTINKSEESIQQKSNYAVSTTPYTQENNVISNANEYYYTQLDENAKIIYNGLKKNIDNLKSGNYTIEFDTKFNSLLNSQTGNKKLNDAYQLALGAFSLDHPEVFYIDVSKMILTMYSKTLKSKTTYTVNISNGNNANYFSSGFSNKQQVITAIQNIENIKNQITNSNDSIYNKIQKSHDWLVENLEYDQTVSKANKGNIYGALVEKSVVCEGYAKSLKYLLDNLNVESIIIIGQGVDSKGKTENHAWNYVKINEKWYAVDSTWDDPVISGGGKITKALKYKYFLKGSTNFKDHLPIGQITQSGSTFKYPELNNNDYK